MEYRYRTNGNPLIIHLTSSRESQIVLYVPGIYSVFVTGCMSNNNMIKPAIAT